MTTYHDYYDYYASFGADDTRFSRRKHIVARNDRSARLGARAFFRRAMRRIDAVTDFGGAEVELKDRAGRSLISERYGVSSAEAREAARE